MNFDERYGPLVEPQKTPMRRSHAVEPWEFEQPLSTLVLNAETGKRLAVLLREGNEPFSLVSSLLRQSAILWIVTESGEIRFALEELVYVAPDGKSWVRSGHPYTGVPKLEFPVLSAGRSKIGHPALVEGKSARIAGELFLDRNAVGQPWTIANRSGRYGRVAGKREPRHLENVAKEFRYATGARIATEWLQPLPDFARY
jgi:hypothetical protein